MTNKKAHKGFTIQILHEGQKIASRRFTTEDYNKEVRQSVDLNDIMKYLVEICKEQFKRKDLEFMYEQYDLRENAFNKKWKDEKRSASKYKYIDNNI